MAKYVKKPIVVDAYQWTGDNNQTEDPEWIVDMIKSDRIQFESSHGKLSMLIKTLEGTMRASLRDYIIRGPVGEIYPIKPDIFLLTYSPYVEKEVTPVTMEDTSKLSKFFGTKDKSSEIKFDDGIDE